ncbi:hypothetical protein [Pseudomonas sp. MWU12-2323]|uniref:hypothetical protein n=1 Tax=Pseudomonas sp. MWU12-2323 TaxID=2651296 RepID=UPI00128D1EA6|nr:hypothetical protein [Pseudomonas sp. MWU12-2323]MPQ66170.1 hypothetical protein [Pseudomonas sp. MWU12-2323]
MKKPSPSTRPGNGNPLRDLYAPIIPNMAPPFEDYQGGIGAALVEGGLKCIVDPWEPMENGDAIGFYWGNEQAPVWTDVIDGNANEQLFFTISKGFIVRGDADPVFYRVTIPGQTPEDSRRLRLFVKLDRPGGYDDNPSIPGHSGLRYVVPQEIIDNGVGPIEADAGVDITIIHYEFMRKNDLIRLAWGRAIVEHTVQPDEVDTDIPIHVDRTVIEDALDGQIDIAYQVVDVCKNYPDEREPWSVITTVQVDVGGNRLDAPQVLVNDRPVREIDLEQLAGADVICRVYVNATDHAVGDTLRLTWVGTPAQGNTPVIVGPLDRTVEFIPFQYDFPIPYEYVEAIAKGRASVSYVRIRSGTADHPSKSANVTVVGDIAMPERPSFVEASGSVLDPDLNFYTISVPYYPGRQPGDHLYIVFEGLDASNNPTGFDINAYVSNEPNGDPVLRNVDKNEIKRLDGGSLTVYYWINSQRKSQELTLSVGSGQPDLDKPDVIQANNDVLNPDDVNPNIGADVEAPYTGTLPNDIIVLRWRGSLISAPDQETPPLSSGSAGRPYPFIVPFQYVIGNLNGTVNTDYYIKRTGSPIQRSLVRELTIGATSGGEPIISDIRDSKGSIAPGGSTSETSVTVIGTAIKGEQIQLYDTGNPVPISIPATADPTTGIWRVVISGLAYKLYILKAKALYGTGAESSERRFTVRASVAPTLDNVKDGNGAEIANNTTTEWPNVTLYGKAQGNERLNVFDGRQLLGVVNVPANGNWQYPVNRLLSGPHSLHVEALYGSGLPPSATRSFTVRLNLRRPSIPKAYNPPANDRIRMSDIYYDDYLEVEVPHYTGMDPIHTLKVRWEGRVDYHDGAIVPVGPNPGPRRLRVPRLEVIDNIGRSVQVGYSVKETATSETLESVRTTLHIDAQALNLPAPVYSSANRRITVSHADIRTGYKIRIRWTGVVVHDGPEVDLTTGQAYQFDVPAGWISENQGTTVLVNYTVHRTGTTDLLMFSQVLRLHF